MKTSGQFIPPVLVTTLLAVVTLSGCNLKSASTDDDVTPPTRKVVNFEGVPDPKFVGDWKTAGGESELVLSKDGTAKIGSAIKGPGGLRKSEINGVWAVNKGNLLLQYDQNHSQIVISSPAQIAGSKMTLTETGSHKKQEYSKS